jgi:hypothetical protein
MPDDWITTAQAAELSGLHPKYIPRLLRDNGGPVVSRKFGRDFQVSRRSLLAYMRRVEKLGEKRGRVPKPKPK